MNITGHNDHADRIKVACDHYLDLGMALQDAGGEQALWPCLSCEQASFVARFEEGVAGCIEEECEVPHSMDLPDLVAYLDDDLQSTDRRGATEKFSGIFQAAVGQKRELEEERSERRQLAREQRRQRDSAKARQEKRSSAPEDHLF